MAARDRLGRGGAGAREVYISYIDLARRYPYFLKNRTDAAPCDSGVRRRPSCT